MTTISESISSYIDKHFDAECAFLAELVKVPSDNPPGDCKAHARRAKELLEGLGLEVEAHAIPEALVRANGMISATNLVVRQRFGDGTGPVIALNAHGDVVPPGQGWTHDPYGAEIADDGNGKAMFGRGVAVSKSDFATYTFSLLALRELAAQNVVPGGSTLNGAIELQLTYDEEAGGEIGPKWLLDNGLSKANIAISAGFSYAVVTAHNGCLHLEVIVHGKQGHAAMPERGVDAIAAATQILTAIYASRDALKAHPSKTPGIAHPTLNVGLIEGGINTNVVPDRVSFRIDRRIIPEESPASAEAELRALIQAAADKIPGIRIEIKRILLSLPLVKLPGADRLTETLQKRGKEFFGVDIGEHGVPIYTDARHYTAAGIPAVLYGAGPRTLAEANGHSADENVRLEDLRRATKTVAAALADLLSSG